MILVNATARTKLDNLSLQDLKRNLKPDNPGSNVRYFREEILELTQEEFAKILNISRSTLALYETNKRNMSIDLVKKIADYLGVSLDILLYRESYLNGKRGENHVI